MKTTSLGPIHILAMCSKGVLFLMTVLKTAAREGERVEEIDKRCSRLKCSAKPTGSRANHIEQMTHNGQTAWTGQTCGQLVEMGAREAPIGVPQHQRGQQQQIEDAARRAQGGVFLQHLHCRISSGWTRTQQDKPNNNSKKKKRHNTRDTPTNSESEIDRERWSGRDWGSLERMPQETC